MTTRPRRPSEVDGVHYHFIDPARFAAMREAGELLEWAEVHGNLYATPRAPVEAELAVGRDVLFDIDWQGTQQIEQAMPDDVVGIFILPPSMAELRSRLERRAEDASEVIDRRLANARSEIRHWHEYDYVIVNDDLQESLRGAREVLAAERGKRRSPPELPGAAERYRRASRRICRRSSIACLRNRPVAGAVARRSPERRSRRRRSPRRAASRDSRCLKESGRIDAKRLQALPQHLAPLAEGGRDHPFQRPRVAGQGIGPRHEWTTDDVTFGGGREGARRQSNRIRASQRQPPGRQAGHRLFEPGLATMRSATSRWNISVSEGIARRPRLVVSQPISSGVAML